jgi:hypothetical protein
VFSGVVAGGSCRHDDGFFHELLWCVVASDTAAMNWTLTLANFDGQIPDRWQLL